MNVIDQITKDYMKSDIPEFGVGDTLRVHIKIKEGNRERIQDFEGYVMKIQHGGIAKTFTVRRIASGVGVEKTFLIEAYPAVVKEAAQKYEPSIVTRHIIDVAQAYNKFYHDEHILVDDEAEKNAKVALTLAAKNTLKNGLALLAVKAPERM